MSTNESPYQFLVWFSSATSEVYKQCFKAFFVQYNLLNICVYFMNSQWGSFVENYILDSGLIWWVQLKQEFKSVLGTIYSLNLFSHVVNSQKLFSSRKLVLNVNVRGYILYHVW